MMDFAILVLSILYLMGYEVAKPLAICAIVGFCFTIIRAIVEAIEKKRGDNYERY